MEKVLMMASVVSMIESFNQENLNILQSEGAEVHVMANFNDQDIKKKRMNEEFKMKLERRHIKVYDLPIQRNPLAPINVAVYNRVKNIIKSEQYSLIHCHTPVGGLLGRLASREAQKTGTALIYTAHGFHFYKGAPKKNWLVYYTIEKALSSMTDCLITINPEDYNIALSKHFKTKDIEMINGVGIDLSKFNPTNEMKRSHLRKQFGYSNSEVLLIYVGELSKRKNQYQAIRMMRDVVDAAPQAKLLLVGDGSNYDEYAEMINKYSLADHVFLLGYREDIPQLMSMADIAVSTSRQEGLPVNIMEAMATGLPLVVTDCRGNRDLVQNGVNGYIVGIDNDREMSNKLLRLIERKDLRKMYGMRSKYFITPFETKNVNPQMTIIYKKYICNEVKT